MRKKQCRNTMSDWEKELQRRYFIVAFYAAVLLTILVYLTPSTSATFIMKSALAFLVNGTPEACIQSFMANIIELVKELMD